MLKLLLLRIAQTKGITYRVDVDGDHLFALADGTLVHNCMPSSASDRFTVDFEYVFFCVKSKRYWFEQQLESLQQSSIERNNYDWNSQQRTRDPREMRGIDKRSAGKLFNPQGRNKRCVWDVPTASFSDAHFATFPEKLIEPMIRAGCPKEVCSKCGKAKEKQYEYIYKGTTKSGYNDGRGQGKHLEIPAETERGKFLGYSDCGCGVKFEPGIVLDPFSGAGTVALVAKRLGRSYVGIELNPDYVVMTNKRIAEVQKELL